MPTLDQSVLDGLEKDMGGEVAAAGIVAMFLERLPAELDGLRDLQVTGDLDQLGKAGHRMKSSSAMLGATGLSALMARLEMAGKEGDAAAVGALLPEIDTEAAAVSEAMKMRYPAAAG
jgi:HPt (histidine-containing phosphotransfer) domain-containing protein